MQSELSSQALQSMHYIIILHILSAENMYSVYCTKKIIVYKQIKSMVPPAMSLFFFCSRNYQLLKVQSAKKAPLYPPDPSSLPVEPLFILLSEISSFYF